MVGIIRLIAAAMMLDCDEIKIKSPLSRAFYLEFKRGKI